MNEQSPFERSLADGINSVGVPSATREGLEQTIARAGRTRQRPRWYALLKTPPMRRSSSVAVGSPTVRVAGIMVATLLLAMLVAGAGIAGARLFAETTIVVDPSGDGTVTTLAAGIEMAGDGSTILVKPGTYAESLTIRDDITLLGDGERAEIVLAGDGTDAPVLSFIDTDAHISNLNLRGDGGHVRISGGAPTLSGLLFEQMGSSPPWPLVGASEAERDNRTPSLILDGATEARIVANTFDGPSGGIVVRGSSSPLIEGNSLTRGPNVVLEDVGDATIVRDNDISDATQHGIEASSAGSYLIEDNRISTDALHAIDIIGPGEPTETTPMIRNNIVGNSDIAVAASDANPTIVENLFWGNGSDIQLRSSDGLVQGNLLVAVVTFGDELRPDESFGAHAPTFEGNTMYLDSFPTKAFRVGRDTAPRIRGNTICADASLEELTETNEGGDPIFEANDVYPSLDMCPTGSLDKLTYGADARLEVYDEFFGVVE